MFVSWCSSYETNRPPPRLRSKILGGASTCQINLAWQPRRDAGKAGGGAAASRRDGDEDEDEGGEVEGAGGRVRGRGQRGEASSARGVVVMARWGRRLGDERTVCDTSLAGSVVRGRRRRRARSARHLDRQSGAPPQPAGRAGPAGDARRRAGTIRAGGEIWVSASGPASDQSGLSLARP